jgi:hypothetical protein
MGHRMGALRGSRARVDEGKTPDEDGQDRLLDWPSHRGSARHSCRLAVGSAVGLPAIYYASSPTVPPRWPDRRSRGRLDAELRREREATTDKLFSRLADLMGDAKATRRTVRGGFVSTIREAKGDQAVEAWATQLAEPSSNARSSSHQHTVDSRTLSAYDAACRRRPLAPFVRDLSPPSSSKLKGAKRAGDK